MMLEDYVDTTTDELEDGTLGTFRATVNNVIRLAQT